MVIFVGGKMVRYLGTVSDNEVFSPINDAGGQAGELMVIQYSGIGGNNLLAPAGWASNRLNGDNGRVGHWAKVLDGSETGNITLHDTTAGTSRIHRFAFTGAAMTQKEDDERDTTGNPTAIVLPVGSYGYPMLVFCSAQTNFGVALDYTFDPAPDYDSGTVDQAPNTTSRYKWKLFTPGTTLEAVTMDMADFGANAMLSTVYAR